MGDAPILIAMILIQTAAEGMPDGFAYMAVGWAVAVTTGVSTAVLSGKLVLGRELSFVTALYEKEKADREKIEIALKDTNDELRLQNKTLAATVDVLQRNIYDRAERVSDRAERGVDRDNRATDRLDRDSDRAERDSDREERARDRASR